MTILKMQLTLRTFVDSFREWLQEDVDNTTLTGDSGWKRRHCTCVQEFDRYIATLGPEDQRLVALAVINEGANVARRAGGGPPQGFVASKLQKQILGRLGTTTDLMPDAGTLLEEFVAAAAADFKGMVTEARQGVGERDTRIKDLEQEVADERTRHEVTEAVLADRTSEIAALQAENEDLGKQVEVLQRFLDADKEVEVFDSGKSKRARKKASADKHHKTKTPGVTYRETKDGNKFYVWVSDGKGGGKREAVGNNYDQAVERKVELDEAREAVAA